MVAAQIPCPTHRAQKVLAHVLAVNSASLEDHRCVRDLSSAMLVAQAAAPTPWREPAALEHVLRSSPAPLRSYRDTAKLLANNPPGTDMGKRSIYPSVPCEGPVFVFTTGRFEPLTCAEPCLSEAAEWFRGSLQPESLEQGSGRLFGWTRKQHKQLVVAAVAASNASFVRRCAAQPWQRLCFV